MEFDFDAWTRLAKDDPQEFERRRQTVVRATIEGASAEHRERLEGIQFRLDLERERSATPLGACVRMNALMWAGFFRLRKELRRVSDPAAKSRPQESASSAKIISLQRYRTEHPDVR